MINFKTKGRLFKRLVITNKIGYHLMVFKQTDYSSVNLISKFTISNSRNFIMINIYEFQRTHSHQYL